MVTLRQGENKTEIDSMLIRKEYQQFFCNVKAIPWDFQHTLVVADRNKKSLKKCLLS